jgi:uncharacterized OB-fold protein
MNNDETRPQDRFVAHGLFELPGGDYKKGYLVGSRCGRCGTVSFPSRAVCPSCLDRESIEKVRMSRKGTLHTFSINRMAPEGFKAPYVTGKVDLPEKVRVFAVITGVSPNEDVLKIGQPMEICFGPLTGEPGGMIGYMFRPVSDGPAEKE